MGPDRSEIPPKKRQTPVDKTCRKELFVAAFSGAYSSDQQLEVVLDRLEQAP